ncbi:MAG: hypothetical protein KDA28_03350, partial [Phycisphaerales bacterium]|nr:hypothetical protein [Phycisphaerales bacterium]
FAPLLVVFFVVAAIVAMVYGIKVEQKRRDALRGVAGQLGMQFVEGDDRDHDEEYAHFEVFRRGHSRKAFNTIYGMVTVDERQYSVKMGDFQYKITHNDGKKSTTTTYRLSYLIMELPFPAVPKLMIRGENLFDKIKGFLGADDIDFESAEFSRRFCVTSDDKRFAYDVITARMMEFLLASPRHSLDIEHGRCLLLDGTNRWAPEAFPDRVRWLSRFFDLWPDYLTRQMDA